MVYSVTIDQLVTDPAARLELTIRAGRGGLDRTLSVPRIQKPGLAITGYREQLHSDRLLVLGGTEIEYLKLRPQELRQLGIDTLMGSNPVAIVVTRGLTPPDELCDAIL